MHFQGYQFQHCGVFKPLMCRLRYIQRLITHGKMGNHQLIVISNSCPYLKELRVEDCQDITDSGIASIGDNLEALEKLVLMNCHSRMGGGVRIVSRNCRNLKEFCICYD